MLAIFLPLSRAVVVIDRLALNRMRPADKVDLAVMRRAMRRCRIVHDRRGLTELHLLIIDADDQALGRRLVRQCNAMRTHGHMARWGARRLMDRDSR